MLAALTRSCGRGTTSTSERASPDGSTPWTTCTGLWSGRAAPRASAPQVCASSGPGGREGEGRVLAGVLVSLLACCRRRRLQDVAEGRPQELRGSRRRRHEEDVAAAGESLSRSLPGLPTRRSFVSLLQAPLKKTPVSPLATTPSPTTGDAKLRLDLRCVVCPPAPPYPHFRQ